MDVGESVGPVPGVPSDGLVLGVGLVVGVGLAVGVGSDPSPDPSPGPPRPARPTRTKEAVAPASVPGPQTPTTEPLVGTLGAPRRGGTATSRVAPVKVQVNANPSLDVTVIEASVASVTSPR